MVKFKFFRGYKINGTLNMLDTNTYATASLNTPSNIVEHNRLQREMFMVHERARREQIEAVRLDQEQYVLRLANVTRVTTVNPTPWTKVKIFWTKVKLAFNILLQQEPIFVVFTTGTLFSFLLYFVTKLFER